MLDLNTRGRDVRRFVCALEDWIIATLAAFNVRGERRTGRVGVWAVRPDRIGAGGAPAEEKIAAAERAAIADVRKTAAMAAAAAATQLIAVHHDASRSLGVTSRTECS
jgi:lipoate-protein ligase B